MKKILLVQINKVDRFILQNIIDTLLAKNLDINIFPEIFHISITAYDWYKDKYISGVIFQKFQSRFSNFPFDIVIGITDIAINDTNNFYINNNNMAIISIRNISTSNNLDLLIERINKIIFYIIGTSIGINDCKNYCIMKGFKNLKELDSLPLNYCDTCITRIRENSSINAH